MNIAAYKKQVDEEVNKLRAHLMGQDIAFHRLCPSELGHEEQLVWLTDRLMYLLAEATPFATTQDFDRSRQWLYGLILFVDSNCMYSEQNFLSVLKLAALSLKQRQRIFPASMSQPITAALRTDRTPPPPMRNLESAILKLTGKAST